MISVLGQQLWKNKLASGVLTIVLGAIVLAWPGPSILVVSTIFGVYLLVSGLAELYLAFTLPRNAATRVLLFLTGALSLVLAILSFRHLGDSYAVLLLSLWIGTGFIFLGVSENAVALGERDLPGRGWYVVLGVMSLIAGAVVLVWPFDSIVVLTLVSGASLMILGVIQILQAIQIRSDSKAARDTFEALSEQVAA
ncbi:MAG: HdeD family acid-resistance protein [Mycobacterium sp.]